MADLAYSATIQDQVAGLIFQQAYTNLSAAQKVIIDGTSAASPPTAGAALSAWNIVNQHAQWWYQAGATLAPPAWQHWLIHTIVRIVGVNFRPERVNEYFRLEQESKQAALDTFVFDDINAATLVTGTTTAPSLKLVRFHVMNATIRREKRLFISPEECDSATMLVAKNLWGRAKWSFARRAATFTLTPFAVTGALWTASSKTITKASGFSTTITAGSQLVVTVGANATLGTYTVASATANTVVLTSSIGATDGDTDIACTAVAVSSSLASGEVFNKISSNELTFTDTGDCLKWAGPDLIAQSAATMAPATGRPQYFRFVRKAPTTVYWQFSPIPDDTYTLTGEVVLDGPTTPSGATGATDTTMFDLFPEAFWPHMKEGVLAVVLMARGGEAGRDGERLWARYDHAVETMMGEYVDPGNVDNAGVPRDVYGDMRTINSGQSNGYGFPFGGMLGGGGL